MTQFIYGALTMSCLIAGLFFLRFWRKTGDRLLLMFALAFWLLGASWLGLTFVNGDEARVGIYSLRLVAFLLIIAAIVDKNRVRS
jgi:hypothetical protein